MKNRVRMLLGLAVLGGLAGIAARKSRTPAAPEGTWKDAVPSLNGSGPGSGPGEG